MKNNIPISLDEAGQNNYYVEGLLLRDNKKRGLLKGFTLIELILSIVFLSVIIIAATTFNYTSIFLFDSSRKKASILNEMSLSLGHIAKYAGLATGDVSNKGIVVAADNRAVDIRIDNGSPPRWVRYEYKNKGGVYSLNFCSDWENNPPKDCNVGWYTITPRIVTSSNPQFSLGAYNQLICSPLTLQYEKGSPDIRKNPQVSMPGNFSFFSVSHSIN